MSPFMEMEWNAKWDWENLVAFGSKEIESPKKLQLADWTIVDEGELHGGSFNMSGGGGGGGSSAKSSISDSSCKDGIGIFKFSTSEGSSGSLSKKIEMNGTQVSPTPEASVGSAEALLGLKLGKRTYFENSSGGGAVKSTSFSVMPSPSPKKTRSSAQNSPTCCQVEGCNADLSLAKEYHRKHRVCDSHSKCPKVIVGGRERRFCQQCSRFHNMSEFDEKKRSCRRRLSDHNARRRKPQQETIQFNSPRLSTPFYVGSQPMNFLLNNPLVVHSRSPANSGWNNSKFTLTKGCSLRTDGDGQLHVPGMIQNAGNGVLALKNTMNPGYKESMISPPPPPLDAAAPEYRRALSLLSSSWDSSDPESIQLHHQLHESSSSIIQPMIPEGVPFSSSEMWPTTVQPFKTPYDADFYSNLLN